MTAWPVLLATLKVAVVALTGFVLARRGLLHETALRDLSALVVQVTVPCLVFSTAAKGLGGLGAPEVALLICCAPAAIGLGWLIGWSLHRLGRMPANAMKPIVLSSAYGNSNYLPIAVATSVMPALASHFPAISPQILAQTSIVCISIYFVLYSPLFWGFGFWWMRGEAGGKLKPTHLLTPPVIGLAAGYFVGLTPLHLVLTPTHAPLHFLLDAIESLGGLTIPLANLILGGMLYTARALRESEGTASVVTPLGIAAAVSGKLVILPGIFFTALALFARHWNHGDMLTLAAAIAFLESATPGATNLAVMGGSVSERTVGMGIAEILLVQYPVAVISIPIWLTLFFALVGR